MPILLDPPSLTRRARPANAAGWFVCYLLIVIVGGGLVGAWWIGNLLQIDPEGRGRLTAGLLELIQEKPDSALRRFQTLIAVVLAPLLLKKIGWRGWNDMGWNSLQTRQERWQDFLRWFWIGVGVMVVLFSLSFLSGVRNWRPISIVQWVWTLLPAILFRGAVVGILEETMARGVLYRTMARAWTPWIGTAVSSLIFAFVHFMEAAPESFAEGPWAVLHSSMVTEFAKEPTMLKFLNLILFGIILSRLVQHRGDIWAAVGLHTAAVGCIDWFSRHTVFNDEVGYQPWIGGHSSKFNDGWAMAILLFGLLLFLERSKRFSGSAGSGIYV